MLISDLKQSCPKCAGSGQQAGIRQWGIAHINIDGHCLHCGGLGSVPTPLGQEVLAFVWPHLKTRMEKEVLAPLHTRLEQLEQQLARLTEDKS